MTTTTPNHTVGRFASPPMDLTKSLGPHILLKLTLDAVQSLDPSKLNAAVSGDQPLRPQVMLTLLAYCYAARIEGSREIEWAIRNDETVRYICGRELPDWRAIQRFRRNNRELVEQCLECVLENALLMQRDQLHEAWGTRDSAEPEANERLESRL